MQDGPSAGVAIVAAITSLLSGCCARRDTAVTGEACAHDAHDMIAPNDSLDDACVSRVSQISLRGAVLPVGGIKEKILGAHAQGVKRIVLPAANEQVSYCRSVGYFSPSK